MTFEKGKSGIRRRFRSNRDGGRRFASRKGSGQVSRPRISRGPRIRRQGGPRSRDNDRIRRPLRGRRLIRKNPIPKDKDQFKSEMDRQMRQYWIKSGSNKGKEEQKRDSSLATKKMNEQMEEYWKKAKERKQQKQEPVQKKPSQV